MTSSTAPRARASLLLAGVLLACLGGCRTADEEARMISARSGHAVCAVCKCTGDLGCMDVVVGPGTPRAEFEGRTYYFCSRGCREEFERRPGEYAGR